MAIDMDDWTTYINWGRFLATSLNFLMSVVFSIMLLVNAFTMENITQRQTFHADRVVQIHDGMTMHSMEILLKDMFGTNSRIHDVVDQTTILSDMLPEMYEVSGGNSIMRIESVHSNFLLFSAMWISSAFALSLTQIPQYSPLFFDTWRVAIVHMWNFIGLIFTIVIFSATTKWRDIPVSNLFYALVGQAMAWMYQYFHMVECTQQVNGILRISHSKTAETPVSQLSSTAFAMELRKMVYMELSVVAPMFLVASIIPGVVGIDEWRIQSILFSSWTLFALLGLHLRFRNSLLIDGQTSTPTTAAVKSIGVDTSAKPLSSVAAEDSRGLDALGYLTYAIIIVYAMLINAIGSACFFDAPYDTPRITQARWGARVLVIVCATLVTETVYITAHMRFFPEFLVPFLQGWAVIPAYLSNVTIIVFGSFLVKILIFSGLSDVNGLSSWPEL
jgi:hypothetical protein